MSAFSLLDPGTLCGQAGDFMVRGRVPDEFVVGPRHQRWRQPDEHFRMRPTGRLEHPCLDAIRRGFERFNLPLPAKTERWTRRQPPPIPARHVTSQCQL